MLSVKDNDILTRVGPEDRLYDLASDSGETADVAAAHPEIVERLAGHLAEVEASALPVGEEAELTAEEREVLEALGYLD